MKVLEAKYYRNLETNIIRKAKQTFFSENYHIKVEVADTPQELVKVSDLIKFQMLNSIIKIEEVVKISKYDDKIAIRTTGSEFMNLECITHIYTQNTNGDFIKQWEADNG